MRGSRPGRDRFRPVLRGSEEENEDAALKGRRYVIHREACFEMFLVGDGDEGMKAELEDRRQKQIPRYGSGLQMRRWPCLLNLALAHPVRPFLPKPSSSPM